MAKMGLGRIFGRLLLREQRRDWAQALAIIAIGGIACTLFIGLQTNAQSVAERVQAAMTLSSAADLYVTTDPHALKSDDDSDLVLGCLDEGDYIESRFYTFCTLESSNAMLAISPFSPTLSKGYELTLSEESTDTTYFYVPEPTVNDWKASKGADFNPLGHEVTLSFDVSSFGLSESKLAMLDRLLNQGQTNPFRTGKFLFHAKITGTMKHAENISRASPIPFLSMMSNRVFHAAVRDSLRTTFTQVGAEIIYREGFHNILGWGDGDMDGSYANFPTRNQYLVRLKDAGTAEAKRGKIKAAYATKESNNLYSVAELKNQPWMVLVQTEIDQAQQLTFVFPVVFFVVAVLVVLTTLRQSILKRRNEIGTFKALGLTKFEIHLHFLSQTAALVLTSGLIGAIVGPLLLPFIMSQKYNILYSMPARTYLLPIPVVLGTVLVFLAVSLLVTFLITYREIALKPVESMRPKAMKMHRQILQANTKRRSSLSLSSKMAGRNILYDPVKALMVIVGVAGCTMLLVCGFGIDDTLDHDISTDPFVNASYDVTARFISGQKQEKIRADFPSIHDEAGNLLISSYQPYDHSSIEITHGDNVYTTYVLTLGDNVSLDGGTPPMHTVMDFPKDALLLSAKAARKLQAGVGDTLRFFHNDAYVEMKVHAVFDAFYGNGIVLHYDAPSLSDPFENFTNAWINGKEGTSAAELCKRLEGIDYIPAAESYDAAKQRVVDIVSSIRTMTAAVKIFALLLAATVIYNLGLLNFRERVREIATLKVLGFHTFEIGAGLLIETLSMTLIGIAGGLALGFPFMKFVLLINEVEILDWLYVIYPLTYVIGTLFTFLVAGLVNFGLTLRVRDVKAVESLKSVE